MTSRLQRLALLFCATALTAVPQVAAASEVAGAWERVPQVGSDDFISNVITDIARDSSGRIWVGTDRGLVWTSDAGRTWNVVNLAFAQPLNREDEQQPEAGKGPPSPSPRRLPAGAAMLRRNTVTALAPGRRGIWVGTLDGLCFGDGDLRNWTQFGPENGGPGPDIWDVVELQGEVWVSSSAGLHRSVNRGAQWQRVVGPFPERIWSIALGEGAAGPRCWLSGFDAPPRYGGGPDVFFSKDGGKSWSAIKTGTASGIARPVSARTNRIFVEGRTLWAATRYGLARSYDGGHSWTAIGSRHGLDAEEAFDVAVYGDELWAATSEGLYVSSNGGNRWRRDGHLRCPVYRLQPDARLLWAATGGGLLCRTKPGEWRTYSVRSNVLCMAASMEYGSETIWVGTTGGLLFTRDGGKTWRVLTISDGLPSNLILSLAGDGERIWAGTDGGIWTATEGGEAQRFYAREHGLRGLAVRDIVAEKGRVWAATNRGLSLLQKGEREWRTMQTGKDWHCIAIQGENLYGAVSDPDDSSGRVSLMVGNPAQENWRTLSAPNSGLPVHRMLAIGEDLWAASDAGLLRSRDDGETWARFGAETLWSARVTRICRGPNNGLYVQSTPHDPPATTAYLNVTRDGGRSWSVLSSAIPGHASALIVAGEKLLAGTVQSQIGYNLTRGGLWSYTAFERDLRPNRSGWLVWNRIAALAASTFRSDRLGASSAIDPHGFHGPTVWLGSAGSGAVERGVTLLDAIRRTWDPTGLRPLDVTPFALLPGQEVLAIASAPDGVWFGTAEGLFFYDRMDVWKAWRPSPDGLVGAPVGAIAVAGGLLYVGTDQGLAALDRASWRWRRFTTQNSPLPAERVTALAFDGERLWGGTEKGGFVLEKDGTWKSVLPDESINDIALGTAREYFATDRGVFALDREGVTRRHLHRLNSVLSENRVSRVFIDGPELWAATSKGIAKILYDRAEPPAELETGASARGPEGVLVIVNANSPQSVQVGEEYARLRQIPPENICRIRCFPEETVRRGTYERDIRGPVRRYLVEKGLSRRISYILTTFGVPLRIAPQMAAMSHGADRTECSVDSELAVLARPHPLPGPIPNPYAHRDEPFNSNLFGIYLVTRLDGPTPESAIGLARDALAVETDRSFGSRGFARFDLHPLEDERAARVNGAIMANYRLLARQSRLHGRVAPPERTLLPFFRTGSALNTFFFLGWGSHDYPQGVFSWVQGAVAVNLDPLTAPTMRDPQTSWVAAVVQARAAASIGNVYDPGQEDSISPANLFRYLKSGFTWAEAAYMSIPGLSWQTVVIGDPLYTPCR